MKRFLSLVVAFVMVFCMFPANVFATEAETTETVAAWYDETATELIIDSVEDLHEFATLTAEGNTFAGKTVKLGADIDLAGTYWYHRDAEGTVQFDYTIQNFAGTFDGQGYAVKNLKMLNEYATDDRVAMCFCLDVTGSIKNLTIDGIDVDAVGNASVYPFNRVQNSSVEYGLENVHVKNMDVYIDNDECAEGTFSYVAGMVRWNGKYGHNKNCTVTNLDATVTGAASAGGFSAFVAEYSKFYNCDLTNITLNVGSVVYGLGGFSGQVQRSSYGSRVFNDCDVTNVDITVGYLDAMVGGFLGNLGGMVDCDNCDVTGKITVISDVANAHAGGFTGDLGWQGDWHDWDDGGHHFDNCTADVDITAVNSDVGGFVGMATIIDNTVLDQDQAFAAVFTNCTADGDVATINGAAGAFIGSGDRGEFYGCTANGAASGEIAGGFWGEVFSMPAAPVNGRTGNGDAFTGIVISGCTASKNYNGTTEGALVGVLDLVDDETAYEIPYTAENNTVFEKADAVAVAEVVETSIQYASLKEALEACTNGETVRLIADIAYDADDVVYAHGGATGFGNHDQYNPSIIYIGGTQGATPAENQPSNVNAVLDLNGHSITNNANAYLFLIMDNAKLTFKDSVGTGSMTTNVAAPAIWVTGTDTLVTIESGEYTTANADGLIWSTHAGDLVITGGEFRTTADDASYLIMRNEDLFKNPNYFLEGKATVTVTGGTYYGFNPEHTFDDSTNPLTEFNAVAEGYKAIHNEAKNAWIVNDYVEWIKAELLAGRSVTLEQDIVVDGSYIDSIPAATNGNGTYFNPGIFNVVGDVDVTFDLNGHNITYVGHADAAYTATVNADLYNGVIHSCEWAHGLFFTNDGGNLTIVDSQGTGTVDVHGTASAVYAASPDSVITVEAGTWRNDGCETCGASNLFLYVSHGGELYITGGFFEQALDSAGDSYLIVEHGGKYANAVIDYSLSKIEISGGTFAGMNPEHAIFVDQGNGGAISETNVVADGYFAIETSDENNSWVEGNTWIIGDAVAAGYVAYNEQDKLYFTDLSDALEVAESGETVLLLKTWYEDLVLVPAGVTFDLNGNVVETKNALSFGVIKDRAEEVGGIKIDIDTAKAFTKLQPENGGYLPIYDDRDGVGMYKFFAYTVKSHGCSEISSGNVRFVARVVFDNPAAYEVLANTGDSGMDFVMTMSWTGVTGFDIRYTMSDNNVRKYAAAAYAQLLSQGKNTQAMTLVVKGVDKLGSGAFVDATPGVVTVAEVTGSSDTIPYKVP